MRCSPTGTVPDAVFAASDLMAVGALRVLREAGLRVPDDVALVGLRRLGGLPAHRAALTSVHQPVEEMGRVMADLLLARIAGESVPRADRAAHPARGARLGLAPALSPTGTSRPARQRDRRTAGSRSAASARRPSTAVTAARAGRSARRPAPPGSPGSTTPRWRPAPSGRPGGGVAATTVSWSADAVCWASAPIGSARCAARTRWARACRQLVVGHLARGRRRRRHGCRGSRPAVACGSSGSTPELERGAHAPGRRRGRGRPPGAGRRRAGDGSRRARPS